MDLDSLDLKLALERRRRFLKNGMTDGERRRKKGKEKRERENGKKQRARKRGRREGEVIPDQPMDSRATRVVVVAATQTDRQLVGR